MIQALMKTMGFVLAAASISSCNLSGPTEQQGQLELEGYGGLILGSTFEEAMLVASPRLFNSYGLRECLQEMPMRGCFLSTADELATFQRVDGIPYGLQLDFNRRGQLTDITLRFSRGRTYDSDLNPIAATITNAECRDISDRTVDWLSEQYGDMTSERSNDPETRTSTTTKGHTYWISTSANNSRFLATGNVPMRAGRSVSLLAHFMLIDGEPNCDLSVMFQDARDVQRRPSEPRNGQ